MAWERLAHAVLGSDGDTFDTGTFTAKKNMRIIVWTKGTTGGTYQSLRFNDDTGSNYARRRSEAGTSDGTVTSADHWQTSDSDIAHGGGYTVTDITNISDKEKIGITHSVMGSSSGAGTAPDRDEFVNKWANTSAQITKIQVLNNGSGNFVAGSYITVLGAKEATTSDTITVDSLEAKKHLMIQAKLIASGSIEAAIRFNNDSGNNYSTRYSVNGSESSGTSKSFIDTNLSAGGNEFITYDIINEASKEKLVISELNDSNTAGAGTAPQRAEVVGKWANTSNAITRVDLVNVGTGDFAEGSEVTVYGTD